MSGCEYIASLTRGMLWRAKQGRLFRFVTIIRFDVSLYGDGVVLSID